MATQAVQSRSDLEAAELAAKAQRDGAVAGAITGAAEAGLSYYAATKDNEKKTNVINKKALRQTKRDLKNQWD